MIYPIQQLSPRLTQETLLIRASAFLGTISFALFRLSNGSLVRRFVIDLGALLCLIWEAEWLLLQGLL